MIELRNVTKMYGEFIAVDGVSFRVEEGEVCVLIGPSGCGKSTTVKLINRMFEPTSGEIRIGGKNVGGERPELLRRQIGYVIQNIGLFPHMSVAENIAVVPKLLGWDRAHIQDRTRELLDLIGLDHYRYAEKYPRQLSGGEAQRIGVARALAADPPILLMDEPFGAVDPLNRQTLQGEFLKIQRKLKKTVVFVTHDLDEAIRLADRIVLLLSGKVVQNDTPEQLLAHPANRFVRNFVGTDRALKRLSRFSVSDHMRSPRALSLDAADFAEQALGMKKDGTRFLWVTTDSGRLFGWIDLREIGTDDDVKSGVTEVDPSETAIRASYTLREALSRMLGQGIKTAPVIDDEKRLVGEIGIGDIERITEG
jgi:osmoprotectant transport system ATP-binding protein